jgi:hypothetical protein
MNKNQNIAGLLIFIFLVSGLLVLSNACWGSPTFEIIIVNNSENALVIDIDNHKVGTIAPNEEIVEHLLWDTGKYHIEAKNRKDEIIFSKTLTREQMQEITSRVYKVIIK